MNGIGIFVTMCYVGYLCAYLMETLLHLKKTQVSPFSFLSTIEPIIQILPLFCMLLFYAAVLMHQISYKTVHNIFSMMNTF
jgi:membrane-bound metal-dependent hydrolase YbcI (DUF457 family)